MKRFKTHTLEQYLNVLSQRQPVPGGGSAGALTGALGAALISMVAQYSLGRNSSKKVEQKILKVLRESEKIRKRLLELVDLDAEAYLKVVKARKGSLKQKKAALKHAREIPQELCRLSYKAVNLLPQLVKKGNPYLQSDLEIALEMLWAAYASGKINIKVNS